MTSHWRIDLDNTQLGWQVWGSLAHGRNHMGGLYHSDGLLYAIGRLGTKKKMPKRMKGIYRMNMKNNC